MERKKRLTFLMQSKSSDKKRKERKREIPMKSLIRLKAPVPISNCKRRKEK
jgi:hypothetical protein